MGDSIWKKELSLGKKKAKAVVDAAPEEAAPVEAAPKQSFWKKELSVGKKKDKPVAEAALAEAAPVEAAPKQSFWKKEVGSSRKKRDREVERLAEEAALAVSDAFPAGPSPEPPSELLPTAIAEAAVAAMPDPVAAEPEPLAFADPAFEPAPMLPPVTVTASGDVAPVEQVSFELAPVLSEPVTYEPAPVEPAAYEPAPVAPAAYEPAPVEPVAYEPAPVAPPAYEPAPLEPVAYEPAPVAPAAYEPAPLEPVAYEPAPVQPAPAVELPAPEPVAAEAEPWLAEPELPAAPEAHAPVVVHPPVPAAELPPVAETKVPFWKKELSRGAKKPKAEKAAKVAKVKVAKVKGESAPFWKKQVSLKRSPKAAEPETATTETLPAVPATPLLKRKLAMPKLSLPSRPSRGGGKKGSAAKDCVGLKIGASQLAAARVSNNGSAELLQVARAPLAQGVVVGGEVREPDALAAALKVFFAKNKLPRKNVRLGIASNRIGVRILDVVGIDNEKQLANAVQFRAQEALPIPLDEAVLDYRVLEDVVDDEGNPAKRVLLVVAYKDLVDRYVNACRKAGIALAGIDLEAFALLRSLAAPTERGTAAMVAVAVGHDRSTFAVTDGRICEFTRVLEWGGWSLNVALARALDVAPSEVEGVKHALALDTGAPVEGLTPEQNAAALDAVRRQLQSFARELVSSLQFYQNQPGSLAIGSIVLTGGTAHMPGIAQELERLIGVHVEIGNPLVRLTVSKRVVAPEPLGSFAVAIGLGIED